MNENKLFNLLIAIALFYMVSCSSIPKVEMKSARDSIAAARSVKAEKYAKVEIAKAEANYNLAETEIKNGEKEKAKIAANRASHIARTAYSKSITSFVNEESNHLTKTSKEANKIHANKASPKKYRKAVATEALLKKNLLKLKQLREQLSRLEAKEKSHEK